MLRKILIGIVVLLALGAVFVAMQPAAYHVQRSVRIDAPAEVVWAEVSNFNRWKDWNPWQKAEPQQKVTVSGEPGAAGHSSHWDGEKTGQGTMTISDATKPTHVAIKLEFVEPMESTADTAIAIAPQSNGVTVTWSMDGENDFMGKLFDLLMDMENMIGSAYETGLADLKTIAESRARQ